VSLQAAAVEQETVVSVRHLDVYRAGKRVLPAISVEVPNGVVTGLLGPSGSGKTTLMRAIVGVQIVRGGEVTVLGQPAGTPRLRRSVAYVTQAPSVYGDLTVRENLAYFARVLRAPAERIDATIERTGLTGQARQVVRTLSGGERSRASLAVALLGDPELLVLDEPTVGLDPVLRTELWRQFHALADEGKTVLVSTHVMDEAERCDELILMREGRIVATGPPRTLLEETEMDTLERAFLALAEAAT
jgi:ABC-2 type transport system ATP-binding protein